MRSTQSCAASPVLGKGCGVQPGIGVGSGPVSHAAMSPVDDSPSLSDVGSLVVVDDALVDAVVSSGPLSVVGSNDETVASDAEPLLSLPVPIDSPSSSSTPRKHAEASRPASARYRIPAVEHGARILYNALTRESRSQLSAGRRLQGPAHDRQDARLQQPRRR
jgi:hypothetical protein